MTLRKLSTCVLIVMVGCLLVGGDLFASDCGPYDNCIAEAERKRRKQQNWTCAPPSVTSIFACALVGGLTGAWGAIPCQVFFIWQIVECNNQAEDDYDADVAACRLDWPPSIYC